MYGVGDGPLRTASGNLASALDNITSGLDDDFLSGGDLTIEQIHSLNTKSSGQAPALTFGSEFEAKDSSISQNGFGSTITAPALDEGSYAPRETNPGSPSGSSVSVSTGRDSSAISPLSKVSYGSGNSSPFGRSQTSEPDAKKPKKAAGLPRVAMLSNGSGPAKRPEDAPPRRPAGATRPNGTASRAPGGSSGERTPPGAGRGRTAGPSGAARTTSSRSADPSSSSSSRPGSSSAEPRARPVWGSGSGATKTTPPSSRGGGASPPPGAARRSSAPPPSGRTSSTATSSQPGAARRTSTAATASSGRIPAPAARPGGPARRPTAGANGSSAIRPPPGGRGGPPGPAGRGAGPSRLPRGPGQAPAPAPEPDRGDGEEDPLASLMELMGDIKNMKHELGMVTPKASVTEGSNSRGSRGPSRLGPGGSGELPSPDSVGNGGGGGGDISPSVAPSSPYRYGGDDVDVDSSVGATPKRPYEEGSGNGFYSGSPVVRNDDKAWTDPSPSSAGDSEGQRYGGGDYGADSPAIREEVIPEQTPSPVADRPAVSAQPGYYPVELLEAEEVKTKCQCACSIM